MKVSAVLIVKNEAAILARCLGRLTGLDEIVVVDTGSEDDTVGIARTFTDRVFTDFAWCDDFAAARNHANSKATGDWILALDADHELDVPADVVRASAEKAAAAGHLTALTKGIYAGGEFHWMGGLYRNSSKVRWVGAVHEYIAPGSGFRTDIVLRLDNSPSKARDPDRNLRILLAGGMKTPRDRFYLGKEYFERHQWENAIAWMRAYIEAPANWVERAWAELVIAYSLNNLGRNDEARAACLESIRQNPDCKEALTLYANLSAEPWKSKWLRLAAAAKNEDVLFVRVP